MSINYNNFTSNNVYNCEYSIWPLVLTFQPKRLVTLFSLINIIILYTG